VNSNGTLNVFSELYSAQPDCWSFFSSSSHVYSASNNLTGEEKLQEDTPLSPSSLYGMTKVSAEKAIDFVSMVHDIRVCIGRIFSFSHREQKVPYLLPSLREKILRAGEQDRVEIINGANIRDFLDAQVVVDVILALAAVRYNGKINVGSGIGSSVNSIANEISRFYKKRLHFTEKHTGLPNAIVADVDKLKASLKPLSKAFANT
jgi:nucleoside-diphosphate-sugar epimerase